MIGTTRLGWRSATSFNGVPAKKLWAVQSRGWRRGRDGASKRVGHWPYQQYGLGASPKSEKESTSKSVPADSLSAERTSWTHPSIER